MTLLHLTSALLGSMLATAVILLEVYLWQRKEYRWDRMRVFLFGPESKSMRDPLLVMFWISVATGWLMYLTNLHIVAQLCGWVALILLAGRYIRLYVRAGLFRPDLTHKAALALFLAMIATLVMLYVAIVGQQLLPLQIATVLVLLPFGIALAVGLTNLLTNIRKRTTIFRAAQMRSKVNPLTIAITGSVGKTSTKEYTAHILRFAGKKVAATKKHRNSEFMVAKDILEQFASSPDVYVVEAAAYRKGEVAAIARLVKPAIGVITAITNQHEALFGSLAAVATAKWELAKSTQKLVLNMHDKTIREKSNQTNAAVIQVSVAEEGDVYASNVSIEPEQITCEVHIGSQKAMIVLPIVGEGALQNALLAAAAAHAAGVVPDKIFAALEKLPALEQTMQIHTGINGAVLLDDSYSGSQAAALSATAHLRRFSQTDKRIVFTPLIELSDSGEQAHEEIGKAFGQSGAKIYVFGRAYEDALKRGAQDHNKRFEWFTNHNELFDAVQENVGKNTIILLEGRIPASVRQSLLSNDHA